MNALSSSPDFQDDIVALFSKRVYDIAGTNSKLKVARRILITLPVSHSPPLQVYLNGKYIKINSFEAYAKMYLAGIQDEKPRKFASTTIIDKAGLKRWEVQLVFCLGGETR